MQSKDIDDCISFLLQKHQHGDFTNLLKEIRKKFTVANRLFTVTDNPFLLIQYLSIRSRASIANIHIEKKLEFSEIPGIKLDNISHKETYRHKDAIIYWFSKINRCWFLEKIDFIRLNSILRDTEVLDYSYRKKLIRENNTIVHTTPNDSELDIVRRKFEKVLNSKSKDSHSIIYIGLLHYCFLFAHPFDDANWRTSRCILDLYLILNRSIQFPVLFSWGWIWKNKIIYYEHLKKLDHNLCDNIMGFTIWILEKTISETKNLISRMEQILILKNDYLSKYSKDDRFEWVDIWKMIIYLFSDSIYTVKDFSIALNMADTECEKYLSYLVNENNITYYSYKNDIYFINNKLFEILK